METQIPQKARTTFIIRPPKAPELLAMGRLAVEAYAESPLDKALSPYRHKYPGDHERGYRHRIITRWFSPRTVSLVACPSETPNKPVGYIQFQRVGKDEGAERQIQSRQTLLLVVGAWLWSIYAAVFQKFDRCSDVEKVKEVNCILERQEETHWSQEGRTERWYVQSLVVGEECRGMGLGRKLVEEVIDRASAEGVPVTLNSSAAGEPLYNKMGFKQVEPFVHFSFAEEDNGGIMMWSPAKK